MINKHTENKTTHFDPKKELDDRKITSGEDISKSQKKLMVNIKTTVIMVFLRNFSSDQVTVAKSSQKTFSGCHRLLPSNHPDAMMIERKSSKFFAEEIFCFEQASMKNL